MTIDRSRWPVGPWDQEALDRLSWIDSETGLQCYIRRNGFGSWCGYVVMSSSASALKEEFECLDVHGGVTYCASGFDDAHPGFWVGFDCAHYRDRSPLQTFDLDAIYRDVEYVKQQCSQLASQLHTLRSQNPGI